MAAVALSTDCGRVSSFQPANKPAPMKIEDDVLALPFVRDTTRNERRRDPHAPRRIFWSVLPSGDVIEDNKTGADYARQALTYMAQTSTNFIVQWAVRDMMRLDRPFSGIEIGFIGEITKRANMAQSVSLWSRERRAVLS